LSLQATLDAFISRDSDNFARLRAQLAFAASKDDQKVATAEGFKLNLYGSLNDCWQALQMKSGTYLSVCGSCKNQQKTTLRNLPLQYKDDFELMGLEDLLDLNSEVSDCQVHNWSSLLLKAFSHFLNLQRPGCSGKCETSFEAEPLVFFERLGQTSMAPSDFSKQFQPSFWMRGVLYSLTAVVAANKEAATSSGRGHFFLLLRTQDSWVCFDDLHKEPFVAKGRSIPTILFYLVSKNFTLLPRLFFNLI
jgi:hypothetical protein